MWKFKSWKGKDKFLFLLTLGVILCILAFPAEGLAGKTGSSGRKDTAESEWMAEAAGKTQAAEGRRDTAQNSALTEPDAAAAAVTPSATYEAALEKRVRELLRHVDGVGTVDVMIVLRSSAEKVIHVEESSSHSRTEETDSGGGKRQIENEERETRAVLANREGDSEPIIEKELYPEISGVIVSASGGGNPAVQAEISAAMQALFDLPAHKIKVLKRVE